MRTTISKYLLLSVLFFDFISTSSAITLQQKLGKQWEKYQDAQTFLLRRNNDSTLPENKRIVTREEWENIIVLDNEYKISHDEKVFLRSQQDQRVALAYTSALSKSIIDLNYIRNLPPVFSHHEIKKFCEKLPKGGMLHIHPFGTFNRETISRIMNKVNPEINTTPLIEGLGNQSTPSYLYPEEIEFLQSLPTNFKFLSLGNSEQKKLKDLMFLPPGNHPFERFDAVFSTLGISVQTYEQYLEVLMDFGRRASEQGVIYLEFTSSGSPEMLSFYQTVANQYKENFGIVLRINNSFYRLGTPEALRLEAINLMTISNPLLVGIDLLGNERFTPALEHGQIPYSLILNEVLIGNSQLQMTMHAGELGDQRNTRDAMIMGVKRIGHGVNLINDPIYLEYAALKKIAIETNLTSNLRLQAIDNLTNHPFLYYLRLGLPVSLSTDDEGIFETDINTECQVAIKNSDITYFELKQMSFNSIKTSFAKNETKEDLLSKLSKQFNNFENSYNLIEVN